MKSRFLKVTCIVLCMFLMTSAFCFALSNDSAVEADSVKITEPYEYPIVPGTAEWESLTSHDQMVEVCKVPEDILKRMTTEALFETAMAYPLLSDMIFYSDMQQGYEITKANCSIFDELFSRPDAEAVISKYTSSRTLPCFSEEPLDKKVIATCFQVICNVEFGDSVQPMSTTLITNNNVKTPNGTKVPLC